VEPENPSDWSEKIREYMKHSDRIQQQGENGYQYARQHFDRTDLAMKYLEYLKEV
jgi:glycosyltransferase involved in cell wall biosynthesis